MAGATISIIASVKLANGGGLVVSKYENSEKNRVLETKIQRKNIDKNANNNLLLIVRKARIKNHDPAIAINVPAMNDSPSRKSMSTKSSTA